MALFSLDTFFKVAAALDDAATAVTSTVVGAVGYLWDGTNYVRAPGTATNGAKVQVMSGGSAVSLATSTKQSDGSQKTQVVDGSGNVQPSGDAHARSVFVKISDGVSALLGDAVARPLFVKLSDGTAALFDAAARAGWVKVTDGTNSMPTADAVGRALFAKITDGTSLLFDAAARAGWVKVTDGTNTMPSMDAVGRAGFVKVTDGTNTQPTGDAAARGIYVRPTDGTNPLFPAAAAPADAESAATTTTRLGARLFGYNGTTFDLIRASLAGVSSSVLASFTGVLHVVSFARYVSVRPSLTNGQGTHAMCNTQGDLTVAEQFAPVSEDNTAGVQHVHQRALSTSTGAWSAGSTGSTKVGTAGIVVKSSAGRLRRASGQNTHASTNYYLVGVDKAGTVANNDVTVFSILLPNTGSAMPMVPFDGGSEGKYFTNRVQLAISTTPEKVTFPGTSDCVAFYDYA